MSRQAKIIRRWLILFIGAVWLCVYPETAIAAVPLFFFPGCTCCGGAAPSCSHCSSSAPAQFQLDMADFVDSASANCGGSFCSDINGSHIVDRDDPSPFCSGGMVAGCCGWFGAEVFDCAGFDGVPALILGELSGSPGAREINAGIFFPSLGGFFIFEKGYVGTVDCAGLSAESLTDVNFSPGACDNGVIEVTAL